MSLKSAYKTDLSLINEGIEVKMNSEKNKDGSVPIFILARKSGQNKNYIKAMNKSTDNLLSKYGVAEISKLSPEQDRDMTLSWFLDTILLGWENFEPNDDGVKLPYSKENAKNIFSDETWHDLYIFLSSESSKQANFSAELMESIAKN